MFRTPLAFAIAVALTGCVAVWGRGYNVEAANSASVTIKYDRHFSSLSEVEAVANASCGGFGKHQVSRGESTSPWGLTTVTFACVEQQH
jgi:hypothetical protein